MESVGLGIKLLWDGSKAVTGVGQLDKAFQRLGQTMGQIGKGMGQIAGGFGKLALASTPIAAAFGFGIKSAMDFEKALSQISAVGGPAAQAMMVEIADTAKRMGIETVFSATEIANGMEELIKAGFKVSDAMAAIGGVAAMAAADEMSLAEASKITASIMNQWKIPATRVVNRLTGEMAEAGSTAAESWVKSGDAISYATHLADVLALAAASTATDVRGLGEGFTYLRGTAADAGYSVEETTAVLAMMSNIGIDASSSGTGLARAMQQIVSPSKDAAAMFKKYNISLNETGGGMRKLPDIIGDVFDAMGTITNASDRLAMAYEIFGVQGKSAYAALSGAGKGYAVSLTAELMQASAVMDKHGKIVGAASYMASERLNNMYGAVKLLSSTLQVLSIEAFGGMTGSLTDVVRGINSFIADVALAMQTLNIMARAPDKVSKKMREAFAKMPPSAIAVAQGIRNAFNTIVQAGQMVYSRFIQPMINWFNSLDSGIKTKLTTLVVVGAAILAALVPITGAVAVVALGLSGLWSILTGLWTVVSAFSFGAFIEGLAIAAVFVAAFKRDNESMGQFIMAIFGGIKTAITGLVQGFMGMMETYGVVDNLKQAFSSLFVALQQVLGPFGAVLRTGAGSITIWQVIGALIGSIIVILQKLVSAIVYTVTFMIAMFQAVGVAIAFVAFLIYSGFEGTFNGIKMLASAVGSYVIGVWDWITSAASSAWSSIAAGAAALGAGVMAAFMAISAVATGVVNAIVNTFSNLKSRVMAIVNGMVQSVKAAFAAIKIPPIVVDIIRKVSGASPGGVASSPVGGEMPAMATAVAAAGGLSVQKIAAQGSGWKGQQSAPAPAAASGPVTVISKVYVDGREIMVAQGRAQVEHNERAGRPMAPVHKRGMLQMGAA